MSKGILPSTPDTLPIYIAEKLEALGRNTKEADLNEIRVLLFMNQEERVVTDEELQEWKKSEKKILENQNTYKKSTESIEKKAKYDLPLFMIFTMLIKLGLKILQYILGVEYPEGSLRLVSWWPIDFIVVAVYLFHFHGSDLRLKFLTVQPVQHEVFENEYDDWENSMTTTELQSRQKAVLNRWRQLKKERKEHIKSSSLMSFVHCVIMLYFFLRLFFLTDGSIKFFSQSTRLEIFFLLAEFFFAYLIMFLFFLQFAMWRERSNEDEAIIKKHN